MGGSVVVDNCAQCGLLQACATSAYRGYLSYPAYPVSLLSQAFSNRFNHHTRHRLSLASAYAILHLPSPSRYRSRRYPDVYLEGRACGRTLHRFEDTTGTAESCPRLRPIAAARIRLLVRRYRLGVNTIGRASLSRVAKQPRSHGLDLPRQFS
ncbi:hypothetical protein CC77DRAFT_54644 [Alternaria alternata]|uniref:Uncharacterized protein n=1 Tax=Alternaria alternata TaxID=5599 RepID=A0A177E681_ALTAL|nr:hypothetical protein CC77DRAFT_54644 [Alternaria alternata]OAG26519.1 hypothetical protein CC77DRAFT_54644 [Alternaria alternata]